MQYVGEAHFYRAVAYGRLLCKYGDVPYVTSEISIDEALNKTRDSKEMVLKHAYEDFDKAIELLPNSYSGLQRITKGAALALKARTALYLSDYKTAAEAAKAVMDLGVYQLHPSYSDLF